MRMCMHIQDHLELCRTAHAHSTSFLSHTSCGQTQQYLVEQYIRWKHTSLEAAHTFFRWNTASLSSRKTTYFVGKPEEFKESADIVLVFDSGIDIRAHLTLLSVHCSILCQWIILQS